MHPQRKVRGTPRSGSAFDRVKGGARRSIEDTLDLARKLLLSLPEADLKRIDPALLTRGVRVDARDPNAHLLAERCVAD